MLPRIRGSGDAGCPYHHVTRELAILGRRSHPQLGDIHPQPLSADRRDHIVGAEHHFAQVRTVAVVGAIGYVVPDDQENAAWRDGSGERSEHVAAEWFWQVHELR